MTVSAFETTTSLETIALDKKLAEARRKLADSAGVAISDEPFALSPEQKKSIAEMDFGNPKKVIGKLLKVMSGYGEITDRRRDQEANIKLAGGKVRSGEAIELLKPVAPLDEKFLVSKGLQSAAAELARTWALVGAVNLLGGDGMNEQYMDAQLKDAKVDLYNSPENGAPTMAVRTINLPRGTIYEMNAYAVGVPDHVIDSQVVVVPR